MLARLGDRRDDLRALHRLQLLELGVELREALRGSAESFPCGPPSSGASRPSGSPIGRRTGRACRGAARQVDAPPGRVASTQVALGPTAKRRVRVCAAAPRLAATALVPRRAPRPPAPRTAPAGWGAERRSQREVHGLRRGDRRRGARRACRRRSGSSSSTRTCRWSCWRRAPRSARTSCRARCSTRSGLDALLPDWRTGRAAHAPRSPRTASTCSGEGGQVRIPNWPMPPLMNEPRQLHRLDGQRLPLAGRAGRGAGRRDLPRHGRSRAGLGRGRRPCAASSRASSALDKDRDARARTTSPAWSCAASTCFLAEGVRGSLVQAGHRPVTTSPRAASRRSTASA